MEKLTRDAAITKITGWAETLETLDSEASGFLDAIENLILPVKNNRLEYDDDKDLFRYTLLKPVKSGESDIEMVEIRPLTLKEQEKAASKKSENSSTYLISTSCGIPDGIAQRLDARDTTVITTVFTSFFI